MDISWLSQEAKNIHAIFYSLFFSFATIFLLVGVLIEYFKVPLGGTPSFARLVGRTLVATILLVSYPEISNLIADIGDGLSEKIGGLSHYSQIFDKTVETIGNHKWSLSSLGDSFLWFLSYIVYGILYLTIFIFDAIILYAWTLLYVFSPILILLFILPQTAGATSALFTSLFEIASWKVVWSTLGVLLWSTGINLMSENNGQAPNDFVVLGFQIMLAFSILFTPKVVRALMKQGVAAMSSNIGTMAAAATTAGVLGPQALGSLISYPARRISSRLNGLRKNLHASKEQNSSSPKNSGQDSISPSQAKPNLRKTKSGSRRVDISSQPNRAKSKHYKPATKSRATKSSHKK